MKIQLLTVAKILALHLLGNVAITYLFLSLKKLGKNAFDSLFIVTVTTHACTMLIVQLHCST